MGGAVAGLGLWHPSAWADTDAGRRPRALTGTEFDLDIGETMMNFTGSPRPALTVNGSLPAPTLRWREGDTVTLRVANRFTEDTSIHWHGVIVPANMDGVPGLSFNGIRPGNTYTYRFTVRQAGTYWYHSHSTYQEQLGMYGALITEPRAPEPFRYDREHVVMLSDWTDEDPGRVFAKLKKQSDYYNFNRPDLTPLVVHFLRESQAHCQSFDERRLDGLRRWRAVAQRAVGSYGVVLPPPPFDQDLRFGQGVEDLTVEQLVA